MKAKRKWFRCPGPDERTRPEGTMLALPARAGDPAWGPTPRGRAAARGPPPPELGGADLGANSSQENDQ
jgi:hypothetical protein